MLYEVITIIAAGPSETAPQMISMTCWARSRCSNSRGRSGSKVIREVAVRILPLISAISKVRAESKTGDTRCPQTVTAIVCPIPRAFMA